jgi:hypothetical protein
MFVTVCYLNTAEIFLLEPKGGGGGGGGVGAHLKFNPDCPV